MTDEEFKKLKRGDIVQNIRSGNSYVIEAVINGWPLLITVITAMNPSEWVKIKKEGA